MPQYYNFIKMATDIYEISQSEIGRQYASTLEIMMDETIGHFLDMHQVPRERQEEFLTVMFPDKPAIVDVYKNKKIILP